MAVPAARGDVEVGLVEEDPRFGLLGGRHALTRLLLEEVGERRHLGVDAVVELTVEAPRPVEADGTDGHLIGAGAFDQ